MKKIFASIFVLLILISFTTVSAQTQEFALITTVANSASKVVGVDLPTGLDSLSVSLYAYGEIDLDSVDVKFGLVTNVSYKSARSPISYYTASSTTYSKTLTVNLDSTSATYLVRKIVIPKSALTGYNKLQLTITAASSGNDATDPKQKLIVIIDKYS